jgi:phage-related protein
VRRRAGYELFMVQVGREAGDFKPIPSVGPGAYEIRVRDEAGAFRVIYVAKFEHAVYVLYAFQKTPLKTAKPDIELAARRYKRGHSKFQNPKARIFSRTPESKSNHENAPSSHSLARSAAWDSHFFLRHRASPLRRAHPLQP